MLAHNCINIMPPNDHYTHQNSCDNKAITILRAQLAYGATLCDVIITTFRRARIAFLILLGGEDGRRNGCHRPGQFTSSSETDLSPAFRRTTWRRRELIGCIDRLRSPNLVRGERNGLR